MQKGLQEEIPVVRNHASQVEEVKVGELSLGEDDCVLVGELSLPIVGVSGSLGLLGPLSMF